MVWIYLIVSLPLVFLLIELWLRYTKASDTLLHGIEATRRKTRAYADGIQAALKATEQVKQQVEAHSLRRDHLLDEMEQARKTLEETQRRHEKRRLRLQRLHEAQT